MEEAEELAKTAQEVGGTDDIATTVLALCVRAKVLARSGGATGDEALVREALRVVEQTDMLWLRGLSWMDLAELQNIAGHTAEARDSARNALLLFEQKQASGLSRRARAFLPERGLRE